MKSNLNLSIVITIITIIFSVGGSYTLISAKVQEVDKLKEKLSATVEKVIALEVKLDNIKEDTSEIKAVVFKIAQQRDR